VTASGETVLFASRRSLTGYNNGLRSCGGATTNACSELYRYRPGPEGGVGRLMCVSCDPKRETPPVGDALLTGAGDGNSDHAEVALTRNLSENGQRIFFDTPDALVAADTDTGASPGCDEAATGCDVYEWEAPASQAEVEKGEDGCTSKSSSFYADEEGCLYLISSGTSNRESYFGNASANGDDVFFFTSQRLAASDDDETYDVYDARVDGGACGVEGFPECVVPPKERTPCTSAETCKPPPSEPPAESFPATAAFNGPGNLVSTVTPPPPTKVKTAAEIRAEQLAKALKACDKKRGKKRTGCEKAAHRKFGPLKTAKKAKKK
jgi:hypothetical protein